ncbi:uncharacterized protein AMSG_09509 [Thecamonas trahens ATCC 50062]|uniref:Uncharacterized protein n=1 Tax=Thecamonas trahens ATCC 50062 TaxID=461836 RepID=A0A0L0DNA1_THETB|nr:hypothetical protein AMSG_09509 [Thecamonas trahens ATCC 50062]KNC53789.1 hypothetical protein AMSG_09509 [Thecamonas trahens ATCC 50062]|eukprot:XP_013754350.1 hypothetical protein AMSG_09509 [Thecamonas trahens ATCC 50062]
MPSAGPKAVVFAQAALAAVVASLVDGLVCFAAASDPSSDSAPSTIQPRHIEDYVANVVTAARLRAWLEVNAESSGAVAVPMAYKGSQTRIASFCGVAEAEVLDWTGLVREALCFGWIDSTTRKLDPGVLRCVDLHPRKPGSGWSALNKRTIAELEASGRMTARGASVIAAAKADGSWARLDNIEALVVPADLQAALEAAGPLAVETWQAHPKSVIKGSLSKVYLCKRPATRRKWIATIVADAAVGKRPGFFS